MSNVETKEESEEAIWVPYDGLKVYLESIRIGLLGMASSIEQSLMTIEENAINRKENSDG